MKENERIMTLNSYYQNLPDSSHPKMKFLKEVARKTGVSLNTARNWILYGMKPSNSEHIKVLEELTGIEEKNLWNN